MKWVLLILSVTPDNHLGPQWRPSPGWTSRAACEAAAREIPKHQWQCYPDAWTLPKAQ